MRYRYLFLILAVVFVSCDQKKNKEQEQISIDKDKANRKFDYLNVEEIAKRIKSFNLLANKAEVIQIPDDIEAGFKLSDVIDSTGFLRLETGQDFLISEVTKLMYWKEKYFLLDTKAQALFIFSKNGKFKKKIQALGKGPGEFVLPLTFDIDKSKNEIIIYENRLGKILYFDLDGNFRYEKPVGFRFNYFYSLKNGEFLVHTHKNWNVHIPAIKDYQLVSVDSNWNLLRRGIHYSFDKQERLNFSSRNALQESGTEILHWPPLGDTIYAVSETDLKPRYFIDAGSKGLPKDFDIDISYPEFSEKYKSGYFYSAGDFLVGEDFIMFQGTYNGQVVYGFYSKLSKKLFCSTRIYIEVPPGIQQPVTVIGKLLVGSMDAYAVVDAASVIGKSTLSDKDKKILMSVRRKDNPVLVFYKVKSF